MTLSLPINKIAADYRKGTTLSVIAAKYGCSEWSAKHRLLQAGIKLRRRGPKRTYTLREDFFEEVETESQAYWLGFLLADARVARTTRGNWICRLDLATIDRPHIVKLAKAVGSNAPIKPGHDGASAFIDLCSAKFCKALVDLECGPQKTGLHGTPEIHVDLQHHFYRGFSDGDGSLYYIPQLYAWRYDTVGSPKFIREFQRWLINRAFVSRTKLIVPKNSPTSLALRYTGGKNIERICRELYRDATIFLDRKFAAYRELLLR